MKVANVVAESCFRGKMTAVTRFPKPSLRAGVEKVLGKLSFLSSGPISPLAM